MRRKFVWSLIGALVALVSLTCATAYLNYDPPGTLTGTVLKVHDGDTLWVRKLSLFDTKIRLHASDAPELKQTCQWKNGHESRCGEIARGRLESIAQGKAIRCKLIGESFDRGTARCSIWLDGISHDLSEYMIRNGLAWADKRYARVADRNLMETAQRDRTGFWNNGHSDPKQGFEHPNNWRLKQRMQN